MFLYYHVVYFFTIVYSKISKNADVYGKIIPEVISLFEVVRCIIPDRLRKLDMTQQELSELTGLTKSQISDYITHRRMPSLKNGMKLAFFLRCHIEDLYEWKRSDGK